MAWNPEPLPREFRLGSGLSAPDPAVLLLAGDDPTNCGLEFHALRLQDNQEQAFGLSPVVTMVRNGTPYKVLRWQKKHQLEQVGSMYPYGLVTVGSDVGVEVYNPKKILDAVENTYNTKQLQGAVPAREDFGLFSRLSTVQQDSSNSSIVTAIDSDNVCMFRLAAGCADGTVQLFDMEQHERSMIVECVVNTGSITGLQWHPHTQNVLAATTSSGSVHVINPKSRKPLLSIVDPNKRQNISGLCWLEAGKNLVVSFDDPQKSSVVQLWDLRHPKFPYREETGSHQQGIVGLELCGSDNRFFTTASREGRCVTWAMTNSTVIPYSEVIVGESITNLAVSQTPNIGAVAIQTASDKMVIHSLDSTLVNDSLGCKMVPNWLSRSTGVEFGFAGKLAWFGSNSSSSNEQSTTTTTTPSPSTHSTNSSTLSFGHISADPDFVAVADELEPYLEAQNFIGLCDVKSSQAISIGDQYESDVWEFLKCAFMSPTDKQQFILKLLGFSTHNTLADIERFLGHKGGAGLNQAPPSQMSGAGGGGVGGHNNDPISSPKFHHDTDLIPNPQDTDNFFDQLANSSDVPETTASIDSKQMATSGGHTSITGGANNNNNNTAGGDLNTNMSSNNQQQNKGYFVPTGSWNIHPLSLMRRAFLTGNPLAAIEVGMRSNRWAEAFLLAASMGNQQIMSAVSNGYIEQVKDQFITTLVKTVDQDYQEIVRTSNLDQWKETAAVLTTYVYNKPDGQNFEELCKFLAKRLEREGGDQRSALLVYLLAGQFVDAMNVLVQMPSTSTRPAARAIKLIAIRAASSNATLSPSAIQVVSLFVDRLINNGRVALANAVVNLLECGADANGGAFAFLKYKVGEVSGRGGDSLPFEVYDIQPAPHPTVFGQPDHSEQRYEANRNFDSAARPFEPSRPTGFETSYGSALNPVRPPFGQPASGPGFNQPPPGPGFNQPPSGPGFNQPLPGPGYNQPPTGPSFNQPPPGPSFNQPPPGPSFNQPPPGPSFNQPPAGTFNQPPTSGFNQPPPGAGFNQPPPPPSGPNFNQPPPATFNQPPSSGFNQPPPPQSTGFPPQASASFTSAPGFTPAPSTSFTPSQPGNAFQPLPPQFSARTAAGPPMQAAGVGHLSSGLPTPWPIPTDVQQKRSTTSATATMNQQVQQSTVPSGAPCSPGDVQKITNSLIQLLNVHGRNGEDPKKLEDHRQRFSELSQQLESGQVGKEVQQKLLDMAAAIQKSDWITTSKCQTDLAQIAWSKHNKNWILALKRLSAGPAPVRPGGLY